MERQTISVHGHQISYRTGGSGPVVLLIHGMAGSSAAWKPILEDLGQHATYVAPDLPGHGYSDKPRADYSVAAFANGMRDLLVVLGISKVTVVGHSLGGGVAMQFCYQFPRFVERLVLVAAGGVMREVNPVLRLVTLPGAGEVLAMLRVPGVLPVVRWGVDKLADAPRLPGAPASWSPSRILKDHDDLLRVVGGFADAHATRAFLRTLHAVVDWRGQSVTMLDRCYLTERLPMMVMWGTDDTVIPYHHAVITNTVIPHSELVTFEGAGHFPFHDDPERFTRTLIDFIDRTTALDFDPLMWRELMSSGGAQAADFAGDEETIDEVLEAFEDERSAT